ncbi:MAG: hypothetical protein R3Y12_05655 [Clostridia bacterium]
MNKSSNGVLGNSIDIKIDPCNPAVEIRADVQVEEFLTKRIWGQIINCNGIPIANTLIKLVKIVKKDFDCEYVGIAHTVTDCEGFYQFDVCAKEESFYKIIVNKAVVGDEMVIKTAGGNCNSCQNSYDPCKMPNRYTVDYEKEHKKCPDFRPNQCGCEQVFCVDSHGSFETFTKPRQNYATYTR